MKTNGFKLLGIGLLLAFVATAPVGAETVGLTEDAFRAFCIRHGLISSSGSPAPPSFPLLATDGTAGGPSYSFASAANCGIFRDTGNGILGFANGGQYCAAISGAGIYIGSAEGLQWTSGVVGVSAADLRVRRSAAGNLLLDDNAGSFGFLQFGGTSSSFPAIKRNAAAINFRLADDSADANIAASGIGLGGSTPIANDVVVPSSGLYVFAGQSIIANTADGNLRLTNNAGTTFGLLQFGGTTSSFPALRITSSRLEAVLADNSAFANFRNAISFSDTSVRTAADGVIGFSNTNGDSTASLDTGISRAAAATVAIGNGTNGNTSGQLNLTTLSMLGKASKYNNVTTAGFGIPAIFGIDFRQGVTSADGAATTLYATVNGTSVFRITADIFATAFTSGTATYTVTWTQNATTQTMVVNSTVLNTLSTATDLINPDNGTNITAKLTGTFSQTVTVTALVEQLK